MKNPVKILSRLILWSFLFLTGLILVYYVSGKVLGSIEVIFNKSEITNSEEKITCYLKSNGVHTDIVVPIRSGDYNWEQFINQENNRQTIKNARYVAFGWGDKGFYLNTPTWGDLTFCTAFKAGFGLSLSAMHVTHYDHISENENCVKMKLDKDQYSSLIENIQKKFRAHNGVILPIVTDMNYGNNDAFYQANGRYNLFYTCNVWVSSVLKKSGIKSGLWTPFSGEVLKHYKN